jgi:hypothetical protein
MDDVILRDFYSELVASIDESSAVYGFVSKEWESGLDGIIGSVEDGYDWIGAGSESEDVFYSFLGSEFDLLDEGSSEYIFEISSGKKDFEVLKDRFEQHFSDGYDGSELVGILRSEYPETSQRRFRNEDGLPSEQPFKDRFGSWSNAHWHAGLKGEEQVDEEVLLHKLIRKIHERNSGHSVLIETLSASEIDEADDIHNTQAYQQVFGSLENAYREAGLGNIRKLESEMLEWRNLIYSPHSNLVEIDEKDIGYKLTSQGYRDLNEDRQKSNVKWPNSFTPSLVVKLSNVDSNILWPKSFDSNHRNRSIGRFLTSIEEINTNLVNRTESNRSRYRIDEDFANNKTRDVRIYKSFLDDFLELGVENIEKWVYESFEEVEQQNRVSKEVIEGGLELEEDGNEVKDFLSIYSHETRQFLENIGVVSNLDNAEAFLDEFDLNYITYKFEKRYESSS